MNAATRAVIERLVEALEFSKDNAIECLNNAINNKASQASQDSYTGDIAVLDLRIAEASALLEEPASEDDGWIRVEDALPVVPKEGQEIWLHGDFTDKFWIYPKAKFDKRWTHWRYAEATPQPPKDAK